MFYELLQNFADFKISRDEYRILRSVGFGATAARFMMFAEKNLINNDILSIAASIKPERQEDESYEIYRERRIFCKLLYKYRSNFYVDETKTIGG